MIAKLNVYSIARCGYYADGVKHCSCAGPHDCLTDIHIWIHTKQPTVAATKTFESHPEGNYLPVYAFDIAQNTSKDFLFTTWNETPSDDGAVGAVKGSDPSGQASITIKNFPAGSIPGYGTHFWILPGERRVVTVRLENQDLNGHVGLNSYMQAYLERFSPHVRFDSAHYSGNVYTRPIAGYAIDGNNPVGDSALRPQFYSSPVRLPGQIAFISENRPKIKKVIKKGRPSTGGKATRTIIDRVISSLGGTSADRALPDNNFLFEVPYTPTAKELTSIIDRWDEEDHEKWDDVGFDFGSHIGVKWLSHSLLKHEVEVPNNLRPEAGGVANADSLIAALAKFRPLVAA